MARYAYKEVRDLLPDHIIENMGPDYDGDANYNGDMWVAAANYIEELIAQRDALQARIDNGERVCARKLYDGSIAVEEFALPEKYNATIILDDNNTN